MAKRKSAAFASVDFDIDTPGVGDSVQTDINGKILVRVIDNGFDSYHAWIYDVGGAAAGGGTALAQEGTTNRYSAPVPAGVVPSGVPVNNNKTVAVTGTDATGNKTITQEFKANRGASQMAVPPVQALRAAKRCANCSKDHPVPVALLLKLDGKVTAGTCSKSSRLNAPTVLRHSDEPKLACSWFSEPIVIGAKGIEPVLWLLEKSDPVTWTLSLRQGKKALATYRMKTKKKKDCSLPLTLKLAGKGGKECKNWPKTITVDAAP